MNIVEYTSEYEHLAKNFKCGNSVIDKFLHDGNALDKNQGITYILLSDENDFIIGYYNILATRRLPQFDRTGGDDRA